MAVAIRGGGNVRQAFSLPGRTTEKTGVSIPLAPEFSRCSGIGVWQSRSS